MVAYWHRFDVVRVEDVEEGHICIPPIGRDRETASLVAGYAAGDIVDGQKYVVGTLIGGLLGLRIHV